MTLAGVVWKQGAESFKGPATRMSFPSERRMCLSTVPSQCQFGLLCLTEPELEFLQSKQTQIRWALLCVLFCTQSSPRITSSSSGFFTVSSTLEFVNSGSYSFSSFLSMRSCGYLLPFFSLCVVKTVSMRQYCLLSPYFAVRYFIYLIYIYNKLSCGCLNILYCIDFMIFLKNLHFHRF